MDTNETKIYTAVLIAAAVLGIIVFYFIVTIIRNQRKNLVLHQEKMQAEIITLENERARIASDLHDDLGPLLSAVKLHINSVETPDPVDKELIEKTNIHIDTILNRVREISNNLMPQALLRKGLIAALNEYIYGLQAVHPLKITFSYQDNITVEPAMEIHLYRIVLEIIRNAIKHAGAGELKIECRKENKKLIFLVADDGIGYDLVNVTKNSMGLGLKNIASRVEILKGELYIESGSGKGTCYTVEIPA
jgi:signal transduction histidine kinase